MKFSAIVVLSLLVGAVCADEFNVRDNCSSGGKPLGRTGRGIAVW